MNLLCRLSGGVSMNDIVDFVHEERGFGGRLVNSAEFWALYIHPALTPSLVNGMAGTGSNPGKY